MDVAISEGQAGAPEGTIILAEEQTNARGRFGRHWEAPLGNIHLSVLVRPSAVMIPFLSILAGVVSIRAIRRVTDLTPVLKWPNDVLVHGKKICGILVENSFTGNSPDYAVVGIGINVDFDPSSTMRSLPNASSLAKHTNFPVEKSLLLKHLLEQMDILYRNLRNGQTPIDEWKSVLTTLGNPVTVKWKQKEWQGFAEDVDRKGNLLLRQPDGTILSIPTGEVTVTDTSR